MMGQYAGNHIDWRMFLIALRHKKCLTRQRNKPCIIYFVPDHFWAQKMFNKATEKDPWSLAEVTDHFKTHNV